MKGCFSHLQKASLAQLAKRAGEHVAAQARARGEKFDDSTAGLNQWRREQVMIAIGKPGLTACVNADWNAVAAHFESLLGNDDRALNHLLRQESESRRQAEFVLVREMERAGFGPAYVDTICRSQFKCPVADATPDQLRKLTFTIRNRSVARRRKAEVAANGPASTV